jgi:hypothetical protein
LGEAAGVGDEVREACDAAVGAGGLACHRRRARVRWSQGVETREGDQASWLATAGGAQKKVVAG